MRRYWLFGGENYYAKGGMNDFRCMSDDLEKLHAKANQLKQEWDVDWWHIVDTYSLNIEARTETQGFGVGDNDFVPDKN